jgi:hypothetical protein
MLPEVQLRMRRIVEYQHEKSQIANPGPTRIKINNHY